MKLNELSASPGSLKVKKRVGRGIGSGKGKRSGRGDKGQKSRSGVAIKGFEGGQMPFYRRLPKRGFTNIFRKEYDVVNLGSLQKAVDAGVLDGKNTIDQAALKACGLARGRSAGVRILAQGDISAALQIDVAGASKAAIAAIEKAGGKITVKPKPEIDETGKKAMRAAEAAKKKADRGKPEVKGKPKGDEKADKKASKKASKKDDKKGGDSKGKSAESEEPAGE
ncbi:MAG: 50S ribosomal protein L15 [Rhodospirillaceae bacterium]|nr:50S ribosomal protein L15 [Rhodospirillaceae bacterium]